VKPSWVPNEVEFILGSTCNANDMKLALEGIDVVFHQAASSYLGTQKDSFRHVFDEAATGTCVMFDVIKDNTLPIKKIVVASSMAVYGCASYLKKDGSEFIPPGYRSEVRMSKADFEVYSDDGLECGPYEIAEDRELRPSHPYHIAKFAQEKITIAAGRELGIPTVALRYSIVHGPRQSIHNPYAGVLSIFSTRIMNGKAPIVFEDGNQMRDFVFVEDVARANLCVMMSDSAKWDAFNVGTGRGGDTMGTVANFMCEYLSRQSDPISPVYNGDFRCSDVRHIVLNPRKLMALGWRPKVTLEEGLKRHANWVLEIADHNGGIEDCFGNSYKDMLEKGVIKKTEESE
jgi:dTDP-L-rhamnose 4-epimerase